MILALSALLALAALCLADEIALTGLSANPTGTPTGAPSLGPSPTWPCPEGYFCPTNTTVNSCPYGFVCPLNTYVDPRTLNPTPLEYTCPIRKSTP